MGKNWRNLPPALLAMFVLQVVSAIAFTIYQTTHSITDVSSVRWDLTDRGFWVAADVLGIIGMLALARRLTGTAATGLRIVALGFALSLASMIGWELFDAFQPHWSFETVSKVSHWSWWVVKLLPLVGGAIAAAPTHRRLAVVAVIAALLTDPVPPLSPHLYGWLVHGFMSQLLLLEVLRLASLAVTAAVALALAPEPYPGPHSDATPGFRAIAAGLWLRVIAACTFAGLMLLLLLGKAGEGTEAVFKLATISVMIVNALSCLIVARGALSTLVRDMPTTAMTLGGAASLWCLGVSLAQLPWTYNAFYGDHGYGYGADLMSRINALSIVAPLVGVAGVALIAAGIAGFSARRGLDQLRAEAQGKGLGFVMFMIASIGIQQWLLPQQTSEGTMMFFLLAAAGCSLGATVLMARLCTRTADSLQTDATLPTATLRS